MSPELTALVAALVCGAAGLLAPWVVGRLPEPEPDPEETEVVPTYAAVAARRGFGLQVAAWSAVGGAAVGHVVGWDPFLLVLPVVPVCAALALVDLHTRLLPKRLVLPATALAVLAGVVDSLAARDSDALVRGLIGLVVARSFYWLLWRVHSAGMGFGDVRLAALLGFPLAYVGGAQFLVGMYAGFLVFALPGLVRALVRWDRALLRAPYPFGPAMVVGALLGLVWGPEVLAGLVSR